MAVNTIHKQALVTGGAQRLGAAIARRLHASGYDLILHYRHSAVAAQELATELESIRPASVKLVSGDFTNQASVQELVERVLEYGPQLQVLVNNASLFFPTPIGETDENDWNSLIDSNLKGGFFLAQGLAEQLRHQQGCIINLADIYADKPLSAHSVYNIAKAGVVMMTKTLARELAPQVRVNAIAPGIILWPENEPNDELKQGILKRTALGRQGDPADIAAAVMFLLEQAKYITGHTLAVDGGRSLYL